VFGAFDHEIYAVTPKGKLVPGFPIQRDDATWASAALVDTSGTGRDDIIVGSAASGWPRADGQPCIGGWLLDYRYISKLHGPRLVWSDCEGQSIWSSATVGVINPGRANPTNEPAIVVGTSFDHEVPGQINYADELLAVYADNGRPLPGWPLITPHPAGTTGATFASPVIGEVTPGGPPVVIEGSCACIQGPAIVSEWNGRGHLLWTDTFNTRNEDVASPALYNVTGSGPNDVLIGASAGLYIMNAANGRPVDGTNVHPLQDGCRVDGTAAVSAVQGVQPSGYELAFSCWKPGRPAIVAAYPLPAAPDQPIGFGEWRANSAHTGIPDPPSGSKLACTAPADPSGYRVVGADGRVLTFGSLENCGDLSSEVFSSPVIGLASMPDGGGYLVALQDGRVYAFGDAVWRGDALGPDWRGPRVPPGAPMVGFAAVRDGEGYYLLDGEGHVYAFGAAAPYFGSLPADFSGTPVSIVTNPAGRGYWVVTSTGRVYSFGAVQLASTAGVSDVVGAAATPQGRGLWMVTSSGVIRTSGDAESFGSPRRPPTSPVVGIAAAPGGNGYWLVESDGAIAAFPVAGLRSYGSVIGRPGQIVAISTP